MNGYYTEYHQQGPYQPQYAYNGPQSQPTGVPPSGVPPQQGVSYPQQSYSLQNIPQQAVAYQNPGHPSRSQTLPPNLPPFMTSNASSGFAQAPTPNYGYHAQAAYGVTGSTMAPGHFNPTPIPNNAIYDTSIRPRASPILPTRPASQVYTSSPISEATANQQQAILLQQMASHTRPPQQPSGPFTPQGSYMHNMSQAPSPTAYFPPGTPLNGSPGTGLTPVAADGTSQITLLRSEQGGRRPISMHGYPSWNGPEPGPSSLAASARMNLPAPGAPHLQQLSNLTDPTKRPLPVHPPHTPSISTQYHIIPSSVVTAQIGNDAPPLPPPKGTTVPTTVGNSSGKRALPQSPSLPPLPQPATNNYFPGKIQPGLPAPGTSAMAGRPSPMQHQSTQSLPSLTQTTSGSGENAGVVAPSGSSSPVKRSLPTAPGGGGIIPGVTNISNPQGGPRHAPPDLPTSTPSSYASARSTLSSTPPVTVSDSKGPSFSPSSAPSRSPPPTGPARSTVSDLGWSSDDKRPLWKKMAAAATGGSTTSRGSRAQSVLGHRASPSNGEHESESDNMDRKGSSTVNSDHRISTMLPTITNVTTASGLAQANSPSTVSAPELDEASKAATSNTSSSTSIPFVMASPLPKRPPLPTNPSGSSTPLSFNRALASPPNSLPISTVRGSSPLPTPPSAPGTTTGFSPIPSSYQATSNYPQSNASGSTQASTIRPVSQTAITPVVESSNHANSAPVAAQPQRLRKFTVPPEQFIPNSEPQTSFREIQQQANAPKPSLPNSNTVESRRAQFSQATVTLTNPVGLTNHPSPSSPAVVPAVARSPPRASIIPGGNGTKSPPRTHGSGQVTHEARVKGFTTAYSAPLRGGSDEVPPARGYVSSVPGHKLQNAKEGNSEEDDIPRVSMAMHIASKSIQKQAKKDKDWAKWALVSTNDVAKNPEPLQGVDKHAEQPKGKDGSRRRSMSTGAIDLDEDPPEPLRRGSFDNSSVPAPNPSPQAGRDRSIHASSTVSGAVLVNTPSGMRRGGARPMPSSHARSDSSPAVYKNTQHQRSRSGSGSLDDQQSFPQYRPSYTDSDSDGDKAQSGPLNGPKISISSPIPQINVSHTENSSDSSRPIVQVSPPAVSVPSISVDTTENNVPAITISIDEPRSGTSNAAPSVPVFSFSGPDEQGAPVIIEPASAPESSSKSNKPKKLKKHRREKSVKEEEDERERLRQLAKTRPLPPKIKKKSARCGKCDKIIMGRIVSAMDARWHPECFRCTVCETFLEHVSSYEHDDRPYCHLDYHELFAPRCFHCKTPIMEEHFITIDDEGLGTRTYHEQHFFCAECGDPFLTPKQQRKTKQLPNGTLTVVDQDDDIGFTVYKGHAYCEACHVRLRMPKCKRCNKSIRPGDQAIEALGGKWCWSCFTCNRCSQPFQDPQFYEHGNKPYCQNCYGIILVNQYD
ncbi:hypothetical protein FRC20_003165 [Serendipita sp. 405]|nr:hypothetical protein FRC20_003165 [Serendipita sp. 405]